jgi:hypothetical protein
MSNSPILPPQLIGQYHPILQSRWKKQVSAYQMPTQQLQTEKLNEGFEWEDPYRYFRFWTIVDFLRDFSLTR